MKSIVQIVKTVITNILIALYQPFWYAVVASVLLCFLYLYAYHPVDTGNGLRSAFKTWIEEFKRSIFFRRLFLLSFFTISDLKEALVGYTTSDGVIVIQDEPIEYQIPPELLDKVNSHYDGKDLLEAIGGMLHQKYPDEEYRKQRCIDIYGKLI